MNSYMNLGNVSKKQMIPAIIGLLTMVMATAQDLEPRALSNIPIKGNFALVSQVYSEGNILPYSIGEFSGKIVGIDSSTYRNGFGDPAVRISLILIGAKPLSLADFMKQEQKKFKFGVSLRI